jgi:hypothetical protein
LSCLAAFGKRGYSPTHKDVGSAYRHRGRLPWPDQPAIVEE